MHEKRNRQVDCKKCSIGFVELLEDNWITIGIIEKYGLQVFVDGMGGLNTDAIKNILENEGLTGKEYSDTFHNMILFLTIAISSSK